MTTNYLHEFATAAIVPRWISAMDSKPPIVVKDRNEKVKKFQKFSKNGIKNAFSSATT